MSNIKIFEEKQIRSVWYESDQRQYFVVEGLFRIIQSITSSKAEPFRRSLAQVDYERSEEIENPELAQTRMREIYTEGVFSPIRDDAFINNSVHL